MRSESVLWVGEHGVQVSTPIPDAEEKNPSSENGKTPSVPCSWIDSAELNDRLIETTPVVIVTGSADALRGTLAPRIAAATRTRSGLFMASLQAASTRITRRLLGGLF